MQIKSASMSEIKVARKYISTLLILLVAERV